MKAGQLITGGIKRTVAAIFFFGFLSLFLEGGIVLGAAYRVEEGDTLWLLAQRYNITVQEMAAANELDSPWIIYPEQILTIPAEIHTVQEGDTLWLLSVKYNIDLQALIEANPGIDPDNLLPDQTVFLPPGNAPLPASPSSPASGDQLASREGRVMSLAGFSAQEIDLLARLVHSESAGEPYAGQVAVAATVLNRLRSSLYPNSLSSVIYQVVNGFYQYSPVLDGRINMPAGRSAFNAVYDALKGLDPSENALGFYNPQKTSNQWVRQQQVTAAIGNHIFFR